MLDEYSDPADCKKQFEEMRGDGAVLPVVEDDYSVPYEVKKLSGQETIIINTCISGKLFTYLFWSSLYN